MRQFPEIKTDTNQGYAQLMADNWDTLQESYKVELPKALQDRLEAGKLEALERHEGQGMVFHFGGKDFQIWSGSSQGNRWVLEDDDIQIHFSSPKHEWCVSVRYKAPGLWEHGVHALKARVEQILRAECVVYEKNKADWCRLSRADYAFDFFSEGVTREMGLGRIAENIVAPSGVKIGIVKNSNADETITLGMSRKGLSVQIYDKGKEIREASGKTWMYEIWGRRGFSLPYDGIAKHCWRVEVRFGKEFLKDRNLRTFEALEENLSEALCEAIMARRLVQQNNYDTNKRRWGLHPLWGAVYEASGQAGRYLPIGRMITLRRDEYREMLKKQHNGLIRAAVTLDEGFCNVEEAQKRANNWASQVPMDPKHVEKVNKCNERYRWFDEAQ